MNLENAIVDNVITLTAKAITHIQEIVAKEKPASGQCLRLGVVGGGCSGLSYKIQYGERKDNDYIIPLSTIDIAIDPKSCIYLKDTTLDYSDGLNGKGFVFQNPNATNTCGCGESFSV
jgi:iron-sulfur cluster assembly protein